MTTKSQTDNTELDEILDKWLLGYSKDRWTWKHIRNDIQAWHERQTLNLVEENI